MGIGENVGENVGENTGQSGYRSSDSNGTPPSGFARDLTFSGGPNGVSAIDASDSDNGDWIPASGGLWYDTSHAVSPSAFSGRCSIQQGDGAWGYGFGATEFVGGYNYVKGNQIWWQGRYYIPSNWYSTAGQKFMRITKDVNAHTGFFLEGPSQIPNANMKIGSEINNSAVIGLEGGALTTNSYHTFEIYIKLDNVRNDRGGNGEVRIWHNHNPIEGWDVDFASGPPYTKFSTHSLSHAVLANASDFMKPNSFSLHRAFNNNAPQDMDFYHIRQIVADHNYQPANTDSNGFTFIGNV